MRFAIAVGFVLTTGIVAAQQDEKYQKYEQIPCKLFVVDSDNSRLTVIKGNFGSGQQGQDDKTPADAEKFIVTVTPETDIHWSDKPRERVNLDQLSNMAAGKLVIPMTVYYGPNDRNGENGKLVRARAIVIKKPPTTRPQ